MVVMVGTGIEPWTAGAKPPAKSPRNRTTGGPGRQWGNRTATDNPLEPLRSHTPWTAFVEPQDGRQNPPIDQPHRPGFALEGLSCGAYARVVPFLVGSGRNRRNGAPKTMEKPALKLVVPDTVNGTTEKPRRTMPNRRANDKIRPRMHLTETEIARLKATAIKGNQHGFRDAVMISLAFRSCLRIGELVTLTWDCISFEEGTVHMAAGFRKMLARLGVEAGIGFPICPHQLRHGGLTKLAEIMLMR